MSQITVTSYCKNRIMCCINNYIYNEIQSCCSCCIQHIIVDRVSFNNTGTCMRIINKSGVVVVHNSLTACNTRKNTLSAAGETCEEVWLNKAFCY